MIQDLRKIITISYEFLSKDNLYQLDKNNPISSRDDILQIYREMNGLIHHLRQNLHQLSEASEEIEFRQNQIKRIVNQQGQRIYEKH